MLKDYTWTLLFVDAQLFIFTTTLLILNCLRVHKVINALILECSHCLAKMCFLASISYSPIDNLPPKFRGNLGSFITWYMHESGCMLFKGVGKSLTKSSKCDMPHFRRVGKSLVLAKVLRTLFLIHFPLILQLRCLYNTPILASFMIWQWIGKSSNGLVCHVVDSLQCKWIDKELGDFG